MYVEMYLLSRCKCSHRVYLIEDGDFTISDEGIIFNIELGTAVKYTSCNAWSRWSVRRVVALEPPTGSRYVMHCIAHTHALRCAAAALLHRAAAGANGLRLHRF